MRTVLAEMMGRQSGVSGGLGGAMQFLHPENNFFCGSIVGSGIAIAPGVALAMKEQGSDNLCLSLFGDGATNTGAFHEGLNLAAIWKLPVLFVCENNQYAEAMPAREFIACDAHFPTRGRLRPGGNHGRWQRRGGRHARRQRGYSRDAGWAMAPS